MKKSLFLVLFLFSFSASYTQTFQLTGKVLNQEKAPVEYANVFLMNDSIKAGQTLTDSAGGFTIRAANGVYTLHIQQFGEKLLQREIILLGDTDLGNIEVNESQLLDDVVIEGRKKIIERQADRLVFHVENAATAGANALEVLKATPMVRVQDETVSIVGKSEVLVMIDDQIQRMSPGDLANLLQSIPADQIKSIEVITTPPAKYEAEGNSGLINIRLKSARANSWNSSIGVTYRQKTYAGGMAYGTFNYNHNKLSLQLSINSGEQKYRTTSESRTFYPSETWRIDATDISKTTGSGITAGLDYKFTKNWTSGLRYSGNFTSESGGNKPLTSRTETASALPHSYIASGINSSNKPTMNSFNWSNTIKADSSGRTLTIDLDYFNYQKKDYRFFSGNELDENHSVIPATFFSSVNSNTNHIQNYSGKADVELPFRTFQFSFGGKVSYTETMNDLRVYDLESGNSVLNTNQSNEFRYREYNEALYTSFHKKLGSKWNAQAGLRVEFTQTEGYSRNLDQTNVNNYIKLFPTAFLTYEPSDKHSFSLNYSRRISRPNFDYLNPFIIRSSPYYYSEGNPFLKPSFIDNLEFSYMFHQKWVSTLYYSQSSNFSQSLSIPDPVTNVVKNMPLNYADMYQTGISTYYNFSKWSRWNSFTGISVTVQKIKSRADFIQSISGWNSYFYSNNDFTINKSKTLIASVNYGLQLPGRYQIFHIATMHILDISVQSLFFNKKLSVAFTLQDVLNGQRPLIRYVSNNVSTDIRNYNDSRGFRISVGYKFGNDNLKSKQPRFGNEDEQNRTN
ncbi:TonB-dependent receptor [Fluviicola sp.]|uniref:TonB-dependent receptor domain-containing protein n=1 Tax=Fluviicola sp. TaxID=1917219 RepID=UPI0031D70B74